MTEQNQHLDTLQDIKKIMERSSRFISLSGWSGVAAGLCALIGAWIAYSWMEVDISSDYIPRGNSSGIHFQQLKGKLLILAAAVLAAALVSSFYFTWRRAKHDNQTVWNFTSRRLVINMLIPLVAGGMFILEMLQYNDWRFIAPSCLIFYGIALVNASKYTLSDVRYLGFLEIILGLVNMQFIGKGLYFWAAGFGILHIIYGLLMWWKYERIQ